MKKKHYKARGHRAKKLPAIEGVLSCAAKGGFGFVSAEKLPADIRVDADRMGGANHGDIVKVRPTSSLHAAHPEGYITKVIKRQIRTIAAVITADFGNAFSAVSEDRRFYPHIRIPKSAALGAEVGDRVIAELTAFDSFGRPDGIVTRNLGNSDSLKSRIESIIYRHGIKESFENDTLSCAAEITDKISYSELQKRLDLRCEKIITIDGSDAKDFDDAVSIRKLPGGSYKLGVHIADVSHYVTLHTPLDSEAFERGTSVYLADRVIPMLPENLSNGVCSLLPGHDRLTLSCIMNINSSGEVTKYEIRKSVIHSHHRMTYENVERILNGDSKLRREYKDILTQLGHMSDLADILIEKRRKRGSIDFELPESYAFLDSDYQVRDIRLRMRLKSHRIIEEFMLLANETVARYAYEHALPFVYRTHAAPDTDKLASFSHFLSVFGLSLAYNPQKGIAPKDYCELLERIKGTPYEKIISKTMLRSMMKAEYRTSNDGHFGLSAEYYCHFTSPIRRYPDLMVHRILSEHLSGKSTKKMFASCEEAARNSSETERSADECERDVDSLLETAYISAHIGEEFPAVISALGEYGIYAELENGIEGMIRYDSISGDYYCLDESGYSATGKRSGRKFKMGDRLDIVVTGAELDLLRIDFMLKDDYNNKEKKVKKWKNSR